MAFWPCPSFHSKCEWNFCNTGGIRSAGSPSGLPAFVIAYERGCSIGAQTLSKSSKGIQMKDDHTGDQSYRMIPAIKLVRTNEMMMVTPPAIQTSGNELFEPFRLPQVPRSLILGLHRVCNSFWRESGDWMAVLLLLNQKNQRWAVMLPRQISDVHMSSWRVESQDFVDWEEHWWIGGTYQSADVWHRHELIAAVPPLDGVHFVTFINEHKCWPRCVLRAVHEVFPVSIPSVTFDNYRSLWAKRTTGM